MSPACNFRAYSNWSLATYPFFSSSKVKPLIHHIKNGSIPHCFFQLFICFSAYCNVITMYMYCRVLTTRIARNLLKLSYLFVLFANVFYMLYDIIQICHASVGIMMECLPEGGWFSLGRRIPTLAWHICFIIPNKPQFGKVSKKTTMFAGRPSENGGRFVGGHFARWT